MALYEPPYFWDTGPYFDQFLKNVFLSLEKLHGVLAPPFDAQ